MELGTAFAWLRATRASLHSVLVAGALALPAYAAPTQQCGPGQNCCMTDRSGVQGCTANDGSFSIVVITGGDSACALNNPVTLGLQANIDPPTASQRYDFGINVALDGGNALTGQCKVGSLDGSSSSDGTDEDDDACGDMASSDAIAVLPLGDVTVPCQDTDNDGFLDFNACLSWDNNSGGVCSTSFQAIPSTPSKCNCDTVNTDVPVVNCTVEIDKQISCDGGVTWVDDEGTVENNEDGTNGCIGTDGDPVLVRYQARNTGNTPVFSCTIGESNNLLSSGFGPFGMAAGATTNFFTGGNQACGSTLEANEPDSATLNCFCSDNLNPDFTAGATDSADFECASPGLTVSKTCGVQDGQGNNAVSITVTNTGDTDLDCTVEDNVHLGDPSCPPQGQGTPVALNQSDAQLPPQGQAQFTGTVSGLQADACNVASANCDVVVNQEVIGTVSGSSDDLCIIPGEGCLTRTAGFWKNHPQVADDFLPVTACGFLLDGFDDVAQALCINATEAKKSGTSMQQLQLARQCAAAELNIQATNEGGGDCQTDLAGLNDIMANCCRDADSFCRAGLSGQEISASGCIEQLDAFNNLPDTLEPFGPFAPPGKANPTACKAASKDGITLFGGGGARTRR